MGKDREQRGEEKEVTHHEGGGEEMGAGAREPGLATPRKGRPVCTGISLSLMLSEPSLPNGGRQGGGPGGLAS